MSSKANRNPATEAMKTIRCAIYTRKSVTEGLEQEFNSLDAQREAAEAFILSQRHEGWTALPESYDDGGFTGSNLERPALKRLFADIEAGKIDCICVYKVDRLSRSLMDFARIMELLDRHNVSFVSVTQQFNSTTSMGRLTLNILLSFAQFERETIAERTKDKMGAARRKGKWVGGRAFLGYDIAPEGRALVVNPHEADRVRQIFNLYLETQSIQATMNALNTRGWTMKQWVTRQGKTTGGGRFTKSSLSGLLKSKSYIGKVDFNGHICEAEFPGIVDPEVFEQVQALLKANDRNGGVTTRNKHGALLRGLLRCGCCNSAMVLSCTRKQSKTYRYYVCNRAMKEGWATCQTKSLPASEIEDYLVEEIARIGSDANLQAEVIAKHRAAEESERKGNEKLRRELETQLNRLREELRKASAEGDGQRVFDLKRQESEATSRLGEIEHERDQAENDTLTVDDLREALQDFQTVFDAMTIPERSRLMQLLIQQVIYNGATGEIEITFRPTGIQSLQKGCAA